jgi:hypothetical protein
MHADRNGDALKRERRFRHKTHQMRACRKISPLACTAAMARIRLAKNKLGSSDNRHVDAVIGLSSPSGIM